jgi:replicative DNA helicase
MLKVTKVDTSEERRILAHMIVDTSFLSQMRDIAEPILFETRFCQIVAGWIWEYYEHTEEAPSRAIEDIYIKKRGEVGDEQELIAEFLLRLSQDWTKAEVNNLQYTLKTSTEYFKIRSLEALQKKIVQAISERNAQDGERLISEYKRIERPQGQGVNLFKDVTKIVQAFSRENEILFSLPGALGTAVGPLCRGDFVAVMGPPKRGKSWWLWFFAYRGALTGHKALFISLEMTEDQCIRRSWQCFLGEPEKAGTVDLPYFTQQDTDGEKWGVSVRQERKKGVRPEADRIVEAQERYRKACRGGEPRIEIFPSDGATVADIEATMSNLEFYEGWVPDILVVDYADILKSEDTRMDYRHRLDSICKRLRGIAQDRNILVVSASQSGRASMKRDVQSDDVAEDVRKIAHITKLLTLSQTEEEKEDGIMRVKCSLTREGKGSSDQAVVLQSLDIGRPYLDSKFRRFVELPNDEVEDD